MTIVLPIVFPVSRKGSREGQPLPATHRIEHPLFGSTSPMVDLPSETVCSEHSRRSAGSSGSVRDDDELPCLGLVEVGEGLVRGLKRVGVGDRNLEAPVGDRL